MPNKEEKRILKELDAERRRPRKTRPYNRAKEKIEVRKLTDEGAEEYAEVTGQEVVSHFPSGRGRRGYTLRKKPKKVPEKVPEPPVLALPPGQEPKLLPAWRGGQLPDVIKTPDDEDPETKIFIEYLIKLVIELSWEGYSKEDVKKILIHYIKHDFPDKEMTDRIEIIVEKIIEKYYFYKESVPPPSEPPSIPPGQTPPGTGTTPSEPPVEPIPSGSPPTQPPTPPQGPGPPPRRWQGSSLGSITGILAWLLAAVLAALDTLIIVESFYLTYSNLLFWVLTIVSVLIFYFIYRSMGLQGILGISVIIFIFGYLALGPYSGYIRPVASQITDSSVIARYALENAFYDIWLLATNPTGWYERQQMVNVKPETPMSRPVALEITHLNPSSSSVPHEEEFLIRATIKNEGRADTRNIKVEYECNKWCNADDIDVEPEGYEEGTETLKPRGMDVVTLSGFIGKASERYETRTAEVDLDFGYYYSTNASLFVEVVSKDERNRRIDEEGEIYHNVLAVDKGATARLSLNVGPQPINAGRNEKLLVSVSNTRTDGNVVLEPGNEIIIKMNEILGTLGECHGGKYIDCNTKDNTATCEVNEELEIKANRFETILPVFCDYIATEDVDIAKTGWIIAELPDYKFVLKKSVSVKVTVPLGILGDVENGEGGNNGGDDDSGGGEVEEQEFYSDALNEDKKI